MVSALELSAFVATFAAVAVVLFVGRPEDSGPLGRAAALLTITIPEGFQKVAAMLGLRRVLNVLGLTRLWQLVVGGVRWFFYKPHPIIQLVYVALVVGCYGLFVVHGYPHIPNRFMEGYHKYIGVGVFIVCVVTFCLASFTDAGVVTPKNLAAFQREYPYDNLFYHKRECETCRLPKVARSKHCRVCDACVGKFDHHCIWLNNCVGERNYRWFLAYLISNSILMLYGAVAALSIFAAEIVDQRLLEATFVNNATGQRIPASWGILFQYFMMKHNLLAMVTFIATVMGLVITGFSGYHLLLAASNTTTNETFKWKEVTYLHREALKDRKANVLERAAEMVAAGQARDLPAAKAAIDARLPPVQEVPDNPYSLGLASNYGEIVFPPSLHGRPASWHAAFRAPFAPSDDDGAAAACDASKQPTAAAMEAKVVPPPPTGPKSVNASVVGADHVAAGGKSERQSQGIDKGSSTTRQRKRG